MVPIESDCADAMQTSQETREEAGQLGRNVFPDAGATKVRCQVGTGRLDGEEMSCRSVVQSTGRYTSQHAGKRITDFHMLVTGTGNGGFLGPQELLRVDALQQVAGLGRKGREQKMKCVVVVLERSRADDQMVSGTHRCFVSGGTGARRTSRTRRSLERKAVVGGKRLAGQSGPPIRLNVWA